MKLSEFVTSSKKSETNESLYDAAMAAFKKNYPELGKKTPPNTNKEYYDRLFSFYMKYDDVLVGEPVFYTDTKKAIVGALTFGKMDKAQRAAYDFAGFIKEFFGFEKYKVSQITSMAYGIEFK